MFLNGLLHWSVKKVVLWIPKKEAEFVPFGGWCLITETEFDKHAGISYSY